METFALRGFGQPPVKRVEDETLRVSIGPGEGRSQLKRVGRAQRVEPE